MSGLPVLPRRKLDLKTFMTRHIVIDFPAEQDFILSSSEIELGPSGYIYSYDVIASNHNPEACQLFQWFRSIHSACNESNGEDMIAEMLSTFKHSKNVFSVPMREYVLIEGIMELCYRLQVENNHLVSELLDLIYEIWFAFGPLHFTVLFKPEVFRYGRKFQTKREDVLSYFLKHARQSKLMYKGKRMIDVSVYSCIPKPPVFVAADSWQWKPLLRYLQYGARLENVAITPSSSRHGASFALEDTLQNFIQSLWFGLVEPFEKGKVKEEHIYNFRSKKYLKDLCMTFTIILRVVKRLERKQLEFDLKIYHNHRMEELSSGWILSHRIVDELLPILKKRCDCPIELKHYCRYVIRDRLNENWQLPYGIKYLQLPKKMKKYLNLLAD